MVALTATVRTELINLIRDEIKLVTSKAQVVAESHWEIAEREVAKGWGHQDTIARIEHIKNEIIGLQQELAQLEGTVTEKAQNASLKDYQRVGLHDVTADQFGRIYTKPFIFGMQIITVWDIAVLEFLNKSVPFLQIHTTLSQLNHVFRREIFLCGNHAEARELYVKFHQKITEAVGVELPGLLADIQKLPMLKMGE